MKGLFATTNGDVFAVAKPYAKSWGYLQAKLTNSVGLYEAIYKSILYAEAVEASEDDAEFGRLTIPLQDFHIPSNGTSENAAAFEMVWRVCSDNQELLAFASPVDYSVTNEGGYVGAYKLRVPADVDAWKEKRIEIWDTVAEIDEYTMDAVGFGRSAIPETAEDRAALAVALHDWMIENTSNNTTAAESDYWTHNAYSCLSRETPRLSDCSGFAAAYQLLCWLFGINCIQVMGGVGTGSGGATDTKMNHAWNMLSIELPRGKFVADAEKWYGMDVRFDQYVKDGKVKTDGVVVTDTRRYCMTQYVYSDATNTTVNGHDYRLRANYPMGYPVEVPTGVYGGGSA